MGQKKNLIHHRAVTKKTPQKNIIINLKYLVGLQQPLYKRSSNGKMEK